MILFKGWSTPKLKKQLRRGIKVCAVADSLNGYITLADGVTVQRKGLGAKVVKHLTSHT